ncbi:hypothetical protein [Rugosimonospora africana]|uniref:Uncharacterized protein n=1 Tax=Rugosimonospora africana TaxID=556532 RepID=A0A8J3VUB8_9ACTN|nr:hypothetical protein [Rugosimonospora africana]GIH18819.1 hypothetical protein Raf01_69910 [Rugosimonospora africana]
MTGTALALHATVLLTVLLGLSVTWRSLHRDPEPDPAASAPGSEQADSQQASSQRALRRHRPGWWLAAVILAIVVNQVLFNVYALRIRHGDLSDLAADVPDGWFALADHNRLVVALANHFPAAQLLSVTALRIPSLLELPFGLLSYLTVVNWLDPRRYRQLATPAVLGLASVAYTVTFSLIEWALPTPYRVQDLVLRGISGILCAILLPLLNRGRSAPVGAGAPRTASELMAFAASAAALGYLVLAMYDTVLLYSLGRAGSHLLGAAVAVAVLAGARFTATRLRRRPLDRPVGSGLDTLDTGLSWWLGLFLVPALAIRYELGFGSWKVAAVAGTLVIVVAAIGTLREVAGRLPVTARPAAVRRTWLMQLVAALLSGAVAAGAGLASPAAYAETRLLRAAVGFVVVATLVCAGSDRLIGRRPNEPEPAGSNPSA